jgi:hypothetical protein
MGNLLGEDRERRWYGRSTSMGYDPTSHKTVYMGCVRGCWNVPHWGEEKNEEREKENQDYDRNKRIWDRETSENYFLK